MIILGLLLICGAVSAGALLILASANIPVYRGEYDGSLMILAVAFVIGVLILGYEIVSRVI